MLVELGGDAYLFAYFVNHHVVNDAGFSGLT